MRSLRNFPDQFLPEITSQPEVLRASAGGVLRQQEALVRLHHAARAAHSIVFTGMGASYNACYAAINSLAARGIAAQLVTTAELLHFRRSLLNADAILVMISQSGESAEGVRLVEETRAHPSPPFIVSLTNGLDNTIANRADVALDTGAGEEIGPSTMTFGAALVVLAAVEGVLAGIEIKTAAKDVRGAADNAATAAETLLANPEAWADELVSWHGDRSVTVVLGRGPARAASETGALLLKESVGMPAESLEVGQFRHGPLELAGPDLAAILIATERETFELEMRLAVELVRDRAAVLAVTQMGETPQGIYSVETGHVDRRLLPAVSVIPLQLLAWRLAVGRGRTPGILTQATKVTSSE